MGVLRPALLLTLMASLTVTPCDLADADGGKRVRFEETKPRQHELIETARYLGALYLISGTLLFILSNNEVRANGSLKTYANNLGDIVAFDNDSPNANWVVHSLSGAETYLFYRARSYTRTDAFLLTALQSALFEFTIEVIQEPASLEDLINTPIVGTTLGVLMEPLSLHLLNSDSGFLRTVGYILNPMTFFGLHEGEVKLSRVKLAPMVGKYGNGLAIQIRI